MYSIVEYYSENCGNYKDNPQLRWHIVCFENTYEEIYDIYLSIYESYKQIKEMLFYPSLDKETLKELCNEKVIKEDKSILTII